MGWLERLLHPANRRWSIPDGLWRQLMEQHPILGALAADDEMRLRSLAEQFAHSKTFEAAEGIALDESTVAIIAVQAVLPVLELGLSWYGDWNTVVVVPRQFTGDFEEIDEAGVVVKWQEQISGEAWEQGPIVVSWEDVEVSGWGDGFNVIIHEVAHKLDLGDGMMNGCPALHHEMDPQAWAAAMTPAFADIGRRGRERRRRGRHRGIDRYAAENPAEFFAVTSEYFFEQPATLRSSYPGVYQQLAAFYRQDPAARRD